MVIRYQACRVSGVSTDTSEWGLETLIVEAMAGRLSGEPPPPGEGIGLIRPRYGGTGWILGQAQDYDREFCKRHGHPDLLAHGFQVAIQTAAGAGIFPFLVEDSLKGFIEQSSRFLKPVYAGDTLYPRLVVAELTPQRTTGVLTLRSTVHNQRGELVLEGLQRYLLRKRPN